MPLDDQRAILPKSFPLTDNWFVRGFLPLLVVLVVSLPATLPLFHPGYFWTHDGNHNARRLIEFDEALRAGQFPVRYLRNWGGHSSDLPDPTAPAIGGLGQAEFVAAYQFPYYVGEVIHLLGLELLDAYKAVIVLAMLAGGVFIYLWARVYWGEVGGLVSAALYVWSPYLLHIVYLRGAFGETVARAMIPAAFWAVDRLIRTGKGPYLVLTAFFCAAVVLSHHYSATWAMGLLTVYGLMVGLMYRRAHILPLAAVAGLWAVGLSAYYWLPLLREYVPVIATHGRWEMTSVIEAGNRRQYGFVPWEGLLPLAWQLRNPSEGAIVGIVQFVGAALAGVLATREPRFRLSERVLIWLCLGLSVVIGALTTRLTAPLWEGTAAWAIDLPFRLLGLIALLMAFAAGSLVKFARPAVVAGLFLAAAVMTGWPFAQPRWFLEADARAYAFASEFPGEKRVQSLTPSTRVSEVQAGYTDYSFVVESDGGGKVEIKVGYFPGWEVTLDGRPTPFEHPDKPGTGIQIPVPAGRHRVEAVFRETPLRQLANSVSAVAWGLLLVGAPLALIVAHRQRPTAGTPP